MMGVIQMTNLPCDYHRGATFTIELGQLVHEGFDVGLSDYPIFDESYRKGLNDKIIKHYMFREIGAETPALFKFFINRKMCEIMPYYNKLYESTLLKFDPLVNQEFRSRGRNDGNQNDTRDTSRNENINQKKQEDSHTVDDKTINTNMRSTNESTTETNGKNQSTNHSTSTTDSSSRNLNSETPQMQLSEHDDYATSIADATSKASSVGDTNINSTNSADTTIKAHESSETATTSHDDAKFHDGITGKTRSDLMELVSGNTNTWNKFEKEFTGITNITKSKALSEWRATFLNIDMMVIEELSECFMGVYSNYMNMF